MDAFQGCYKDGTNDSRDHRRFAAAFLLARILFFILFALSPTALCYGAVLFVFIPLAMAIVILQHLYYDATIEYFGDQHLPYGVLAVFVMLVFIFFPVLLLLLYPMRCFQRCLSCIGVRWHALPIFIDAFQGCYKDGTNGTWDCRYFAAPLPVST